MPGQRVEPLHAVLLKLCSQQVTQTLTLPVTFLCIRSGASCASWDGTFVLSALYFKSIICEWSERKSKWIIPTQYTCIQNATSINLSSMNLDCSIQVWKGQCSDPVPLDPPVQQQQEILRPNTTNQIPWCQPSELTSDLRLLHGSRGLCGGLQWSR